MSNYKILLGLIFIAVLIFGCGSSSGSSSNGADVSSSDISLSLLGELPAEVSESSGLIKADGKLYTHNDSGDSPWLYEIDPVSGSVLRTIIVNGADNVDWEDVASDDTHIYIGDFGNNLGDRSDLKIYKILISDLILNVVNAEIISFSYADQSIYGYAPFTTPYDAEALVSYNGTLYLFTKSWDDYISKIYKFPNQAGTYSVSPVGERHFDILVTGASIDKVNNSIALVGYSNPYDTTTPFKSQVIVLNDFIGDDLFSGSVKVHEILNSFEGGQIESIVYETPSKFYISSEGNPTAKFFEVSHAF